MVDITLFEVHLDDSSLTANNPFSRGRKSVEAGDGGLTSKSSSSSKGKLLGALVGLVFLAAVAYLARKKVGGGSDKGEEKLEVSGVTA
jgi:hypothetical protein